MKNRTRWILAGTAMLAIASASRASVVTDNLTYSYDGDQQTATQWTSSTPGTNTTRKWSMGGGVTLGDSGSAGTNIATAYSFDGGFGTDYDGGFNALAPTASFEIWIKPADLTGGKQVIFESGGTARGLSIILQDDTIWFAAKGSGTGNTDPDVTLSKKLTAADIGDYIQIVATVDGSSTHLYVNPVGSSSPSTPAASGQGVSGWHGTEIAGLAGIANSLGGGNSNGDGQWAGGVQNKNFVNFRGQIGLVRIYDDVLTGSEVADNFNATVVPEPASVALAGLGAAVLMSHRRSR